MIGKLVLLGAVVLGVGAAGDVGVRGYAEQQMKARIDASPVQAKGTTVHIASFPFVGRILGEGKVGTISFHIDSAREGRIVIGPVDVHLRDVVIDRTELTQHQRLVLTRIGTSDVVAEISDSTLSQLFGVPVHLTPGTVEVTIKGVTVSAKVTVDKNGLTVAPLGLAPFALELPTSLAMPCLPSVEVVGGRLRLTCQFTSVPPELVRAAAKVHA